MYCSMCFTGIEDNYMFCPMCGSRTDCFDDGAVLPIRKKQVAVQLMRKKLGLAAEFARELIDEGVADLDCYCYYLRAVSEECTVIGGKAVDEAVKLLEEASAKEGVAASDPEIKAFLLRRIRASRGADEKPRTRAGKR